MDGANPARFSGEKFYAAPDPLPKGEPGDLIRYEPISAAEDGGPAQSGTTYRIMYRSESLRGRPIPVTGTVAVPAGDAPAAGRRVVTVGHPSSGVADPCAPSKQAAANDILSQSLVEDGYLVATSDYEGLGTPGRHPYLVGRSEGRGVLDAAKAALQLPGAEAGSEIGIFGFSQGGHAALWAAQIAADWAPELEPVGVVAGAPESEVGRVARRAVDSPRLAYYLVAGYLETYPDLDPDAVLTPSGRELLDPVADSCRGLRRRLADSDLFRTEGFGEDPWQGRLRENLPGTGSSEVPALILHSDEDTIIPPSDSRVLTDRLCRRSWPVERRTYAGGGNHLGSVFAISFDAQAWLRSRFSEDGEPQSSCDSA